MDRVVLHSNNSLPLKLASELNNGIYCKNTYSFAHTHSGHNRVPDSNTWQGSDDGRIPPERLTNDGLEVRQFGTLSGAWHTSSQIRKRLKQLGPQAALHHGLRKDRPKHIDKGVCGGATAPKHTPHALLRELRVGQRAAQGGVLAGEGVGQEGGLGATHAAAPDDVNGERLPLLDGPEVTTDVAGHVGAEPLKRREELLIDEGRPPSSHGSHDPVRVALPQRLGVFIEHKVVDGVETEPVCPGQDVNWLVGLGQLIKQGLYLAGHIRLEFQDTRLREAPLQQLLPLPVCLVVAEAQQVVLVEYALGEVESLLLGERARAVDFLDGGGL